MVNGSDVVQEPDTIEELRVERFQRVHSPSSILTYKQCPRKYFYRYIAKLPTRDSIHLLRGSIVHKVLEDIYDIDVTPIPEASFPVTLRVILQEMFRKEWDANTERLRSLGLDDASLDAYREETRGMINNFFHYLLERMRAQGLSYHQAFQRVRPQREVELRSETHGVRGFADAIHEEDGKTVILDYKTSKHADITPEYHLQLSIYGMIYQEIARLPDEVGIFFLKHGQEQRIKMTNAMVQHAKEQVREVHTLTQSKDMREYPKNPSPLCKWSSGQCDFYDTCFAKTLSDYDSSNIVRIGAVRTPNN